MTRERPRDPSIPAAFAQDALKKKTFAQRGIRFARMALETGGAHR
jgi:hypothetical protein